MNATIVQPLVFKMSVFQTQFSSFEEIFQTADLSKIDRCYEIGEAKKFLFSPILSSEEIPIKLFWNGIPPKGVDSSEYSIPGLIEVYDYFKKRKHKPIQKPHSSILLNSMELLSEEALEGIGIPDFVDVIMLSEFFIPGNDDVRSFPRVKRHNGKRELDCVPIDGEWSYIHAFLVS